ncbi:Uncharacterised protein [Mycobacterium tuberculosis]|nr:Uncharacterised protein [Mycobacterium tuberculosis]COX16010.1 Uncharacterised protein [Mycobacterium tuberculosis]
MRGHAPFAHGWNTRRPGYRRRWPFRRRLIGVVALVAEVIVVAVMVVMRGIR